MSNIFKVYSKTELSQDFSLKKYHLVSVKNHQWIKVQKVGREVHEAIEGAKNNFPNAEVRDTSHLPVKFTEYQLKEGTTLDIEIVKKMPKRLLLEVRSAMQKISEELRTESVVFGIYDRETEEFFIKVPAAQKVTSSTYKVDAEYSEEHIYSNPNWTICLEFHSHPFGTGKGFFSGTDENSIDTVVSRLYGNITFGPKEDKFGGIKCKFPGVKGFLYPELFFEEIPEMNDKFEPVELSEEVLEDIKKVVENNKPKPVATSPFYTRGYPQNFQKRYFANQGRSAGMESEMFDQQELFPGRRVYEDPIEQNFVDNVGEGREAFIEEVLNPWELDDEELEDVWADLESDGDKLNLSFHQEVEGDFDDEF